MNMEEPAGHAHFLTVVVPSQMQGDDDDEEGDGEEYAEAGAGGDGGDDGEGGDDDAGEVRLQILLHTACRCTACHNQATDSQPPTSHSNRAGSTIAQMLLNRSSRYVPTENGSPVQFGEEEDDEDDEDAEEPGTR
jgi:hypothetical protein